ncbi:MAG TPA: hypothetical protein VHB54_13405 [Mucilaginibacter sp.]|nr:hypothetical protein [Mucilaginibacter sp.]
MGCLPVLLLTVSSICYGQKIKSDQIPYAYNKPPAVTVDKSIKNYQVVMDAAYEAKNKQLQKDYEDAKRAAVAKYRQDYADYQAQVKAADARYDKELADYNKKSLGNKIIEGGKPVRQIPQKPYLTDVPPPVLQQSYDYSALGSTYITLQGYQNAPDNALKIVVTLIGYDYTQPRNITEESDDLKVGGSGSGVHKTTYYHTEFSYRHPMTVRVLSPDGKELLSLTPPELNSYKIYKSDNTTTPQRIDKELLVKNFEQKILQENLKFLNNLLNDKFAFSSVKRTATLYYIKNDDATYQDLTTAFNEASSGLIMLQQDYNSAKGKLDKSIDLWNTALKEADPNNKKARINKDITLVLYFNLLEAYFAEGDAVNGQNTLEKMNTLNLSMSDRRTKIGYEMLFSELKSRQQKNQ